MRSSMPIVPQQSTCGRRVHPRMAVEASQCDALASFSVAFPSAQKTSVDCARGMNAFIYPLQDADLTRTWSSQRDLAVFLHFDFEPPMLRLLVFFPHSVVILSLLKKMRLSFTPVKRRKLQ